jgi:hypothetical protein
MDRTCDAHVWAGNLEIQGATHDGKVTKGYGESFWTINSKYPGRVEAREFKFLGK